MTTEPDPFLSPAPDGFRASSLTTAVQRVSGGIGGSLLPEVAIDVEGSPECSLGVVPFDEPAPRRTIGLARRASSIRKDAFRLLARGR